MANPETHLDSAFPIERKTATDIDVSHMRNLMLITSPDSLIDNLRQYYANSADRDLVEDAIEDLEVFYGDHTRNFSTVPAMMFPLRVAQIAPSEGENVPASVTVIRLLQNVAKLDTFNIEAYGEEVAIGTKALARQSEETYAEYLTRIKETDQMYPQLKLVTTKAKAIIHNSLDPALLPVGIPRRNNIRIAMDTRLQRYSDNVKHLFGEDKTWLPKVRAGIHMGKNAVFDRLKNQL